MKRFMVAAIAVLVAAPAHADDSDQTRTEDLNCDQLEYVASWIMEWRLEGKSASEVMKDFQKGGLGHEIVKDAYSQDHEIFDAAKEAAVNDFKSRWYLRCIEADE